MTAVTMVWHGAEVGHYAGWQKTIATSVPRSGLRAVFIETEP